MQFKHPEILYFLGLLIIPILVHLFQLQRFEKVPFTNVAFLQKLVLQTRKSSQLKKWLILSTRLLLLTALIMAFSQPFFSNLKVDEQQNFVIYLDNSLSLSAKGSKGELLPITIQELIENSHKEANYTLITNDNFYKNITASRLRELLLSTQTSGSLQNLQNVFLKIKDLSSEVTSKHLIISDFQNITDNDFTNLPLNSTLVQTIPELKSNISIDSVAVISENSSDLRVDAFITNKGIAKENIPISIFNDTTLVNKQTFSVDENKTSTVSFQIQKTTSFLGKITINSDDAYTFDNTFRFVLDNSNKTNVLAIGNNNDFLSRIYTATEFNFTSTSLTSVNYNSIDKQQLIILNEIDNLPVGFINSLIDYNNKGGNLVIIPSTTIDINSYNQLCNKLSLGKINQQKKDTLKITAINYEHPIFKGVFEKRVSNFQYPTTSTYYSTTFTNTSNLISLENGLGFIQQLSVNNSNLFWVASPLNVNVTNFTNSPLIVPAFYNIGLLSLQHPKLFYRIGNKNTIEVPKQLNENEILSIKNNQTSFIPLQQAFQAKVKIETQQQPLVANFYSIANNNTTIKNIAFNYNKKESNLAFYDIQQLTKTNNQITISTSVKDTLQKMNDKSKVHWLWKWFLALAIVSLLLEILILKFFKP